MGPTCSTTTHAGKPPCAVLSLLWGVLGLGVPLDMGGYRAWQAATEEPEAGWGAERAPGVCQNDVRTTLHPKCSQWHTPFDLRCPWAPRFKQQKQHQAGRAQPAGTDINPQTTQGRIRDVGKRAPEARRSRGWCRPTDQRHVPLTALCRFFHRARERRPSLRNPGLAGGIIK